MSGCDAVQFVLMLKDLSTFPGTVEAGVIELTTDVYLGYFSGRSVSTAESVASSSKGGFQAVVARRSPVW